VLALHLAIRNTLYRSSTLYLFNKILPPKCFSNSTLHRQNLLWVSMLAFRRILRTQLVPILSCSQHTHMWFHSLVLPANAHAHNGFRLHRVHSLLHMFVFNVCLSTKYHHCNRFLPCFISNTHHKNLHGHLSVNTSRTVLSTHHTCCTLPIKFSCLSLNKCHKCFAFDTLHSQHTS